ncbi:MAG: YHS domain-containing (seleno)protein [Flavobacteriaceae bacterium]
MTRAFAGAAGAAALIVATAPGAGAQDAAAADPVQTLTFYADPLTGYAINGFDPVSFFVGPDGRQGRSGLEVQYGGAYWRFANEGNLAAFNENPAVFTPAFGGYGVVAMSRGVASAGNPELFSIFEGRLYFFISEGNRQVFLRDPHGVIAEAARQWPTLQATILR